MTQSDLDTARSFHILLTLHCFLCIFLQNMIRQVKKDIIQSTDWVNKFDQLFDLKLENKIIVGMKSYHESFYEDRQFSFYYRDSFFDQPLETNVLMDQVTSISEYDSVFNLKCDKNKAIRGVWSEHSNEKEDRIFQFTCTTVEMNDGSGIQETRLDNCESTNYQNNYDGPIDYKCPLGSVLTGIESMHDNNFEDRRFKFRCCEVFPVPKPPSQTCKCF